MTGCETCDWHGPEIGDTLEAEARQLHRALHETTRRITAACSTTVDEAARGLRDLAASFRR